MLLGSHVRTQGIIINASLHFPASPHVAVVLSDLQGKQQSNRHVWQPLSQEGVVSATSANPTLCFSSVWFLVVVFFLPPLVVILEPRVSND